MALFEITNWMNQVGHLIMNDFNIAVFLSFPGVDILKLVAAQIGSQWIDMYRSLANANEREVAAFSKSYSADHERAYAALQHWTICDSDANLAKLINALHHHRRIDVVEKIRGVMEDNPQVSSTKHYIGTGSVT